MSLSLTSDPAVLASFERITALVSARGEGITMRQLGAASALARAWVSKDQNRVDELAEQLQLDPEALRDS